MSQVLTSPLIAPVLALNGWTLVMEVWMLATRIPVLQRLKITSNNTMTKDEMSKMIPPQVRWIADNYNHLMEQPTNFYAVTLALAIIRRLGDKALNVDANGLVPGEMWDKRLAWGYVGLRIAHSFTQAKGNKVERRFLIFFMSSIVLGAMTVRGALAL